MPFDLASPEPHPAPEFLELLKAEVRHQNARLEHPFVRLLFDGKLSLDQVRGWAKQDYALKRCPTWWNAGRLLNSPDLATQRQVVRSVIEALGEEAGGPTEMYLEFCTRFVRANDRVYHIDRDGMEWFTEHIVADAGHSSLGERLVLEHATTKEVQNRVWDAVVRSKAAYWVFFEGLHQAYVLGDPAAYPHYGRGRDLPTHYPFARG